MYSKVYCTMFGSVPEGNVIKWVSSNKSVYCIRLIIAFFTNVMTVKTCMLHTEQRIAGKRFSNLIWNMIA